MVSTYIIAAFSSFTRPIWIDEFLHFALGSHRSTAEAWLSTKETLPTFNFGQTEVYMMFDYWLLHNFGASAFLLRLPSLFAAGLLLFSAVHIALHLRFGLGWTLLLLTSFFCQQNVLYYAGEARPYLPLAAGVMGALAFYIVPTGQRGATQRIFGAFVIWFGVIFHPYFALYWLCVAAFAFVMNHHPSRPVWRELALGFVRHCDLLISVPAALACAALRYSTWIPFNGSRTTAWSGPSCR